MAKRTGEYVPDKDTLARLQRHLYGGASAEDEAYLRELYNRDPNFAYYYKRAKAAMGGTARGRGGYGSANRFTLGGGTSLPVLNNNLAQRTYGGQASGRTISPGGFKKSGLDQDSDIRRSGYRTPDAVLDEIARTTSRRKASGVKNARKFSDLVDTPDGGIEFNGRKYSKSQVDWIRKRALSGATLSADQQAIYDFGVREKRRYQAALDAERKRKEDADAAAEARRQKDEEDLTKRERNRAEWRYRTDYASRLGEARKKAADDAKKAAEDARFEALNEKHGLAAGTRLSQKDYDDLEAGRKKWGYSRKDQEAVDKIRADLDDARRSLIFNSNEWNRVTKEADDAISRFDKRLIDKPREERTAQDIIGEAAQNGGYYMDPTGKMVYLRDEEAERAAKVEDRDIANRQRIAIAAENARMSALKAHEAAQANARKDWESAKDKYGKPLHGQDDPFVPAEFDPNFSQNYIRNVQGNMALLGEGGDGSSPTVQTGGYICPLCQSQMPSPDGPCPVCGWPTQNIDFNNPEAPAAPADDVGDWTSGFGGVDPRATYEEE